MSELKATPGPWGVHFEEAVRIKGTTGTIAIATNISLSCRIEPSEVSANARLIAAAPDLYEALNNLFFYAADELGLEQNAEDSLISKVQSALAKARGES